jgi:hypothetical protein
VASFYADESFPLEVVESLRRLGHDVLTALEAEQANVLTLNRWDFVRIHSRMPQHAGIVACTQDPDGERQGIAIDAAVRRAADLRGLLLRVNRPS